MAKKNNFVRKIIGRFVNLALGMVKKRYYDKKGSSFPLQKADKSLLFANSLSEVTKKSKKQINQLSRISEFSQVEATYPKVFEHGDYVLRYSFLKAKKESLGIVSFFHGHNAFLQAGPFSAWDYFDLIAPWDNFGWRRQGSWFWGDKGNNYTEKIILALHEKVISDSGKPWFCFGGSMGGFAALYHGIKYDCDGIYAMMPQVDLRKKIIDFGIEDTDNPYGFLHNGNLNSLPDVLEIAKQKEMLPPVFIMQNQYDPVNKFKEHSQKLLEVYNEKSAWYGIRVLPGLGHYCDGSYKEAEYFFKTLVEKGLPKKHS